MMGKKYGRLSFDERIEIEKLLSHKKSYGDIAMALNRSKSTIQRDVIKQGTEQYKAMEAERLAVGKSSNRKSGKNKIQQYVALENYVFEKLALRWSPRQIRISLQRQFPENKAMQISHEAIYLYIYMHSKKELKNLLISELRQKRKYRGNVRRGVAVMSFWDDIKPMSPTSAERIGYPTQKPMLLLKRIIEAASNEGDLILDPFVGGGTSIATADKFNRRWIGIDQSVQAIKVTELRMQLQQDLFSKPFIVQLHKYDYDTLRYKDAFEFESWIVTQFGGTSNIKQRSDLGLDGKTKDNTPIQVKRSDNVGRNVIDNFLSAVQRYDKSLYEKNKIAKQPVGYIIAFSFGKGAIQEVARLKNQEDVIIKLVTVEEIIPIAKKPTLTIQANEVAKDKNNIRELELVATGQSAAGIEFYNWDFDYKEQQGFKAAIIIDKQGIQRHKFKAGLHNIAVKVVDNDGLDNIEIIKLKVNGTIEHT